MVPLGRTAPRYGVASLADVLPSALAVLGVRGEPDALGLGVRGEPDAVALGPRLAEVRRIAVLLVDGLGWHQLPLAAPYAPTLTALATGQLGGARPITSGFPSTTPTSLVTLGTGVAPGAHGIVGFTVNVPGTTDVLTHIDWRGEPDPATWQPVPTAFERAAAAGVATTVVSKPEFAGSGLTVAAYRGSAYRSASTVDDTAVEMLAALAARPGLVYGYYADVDATGHFFGVGSPAWCEAVIALDRLLTRLVDGLPSDAALLVTADHGQLDVPPECRFDLDEDPRLRAGIAVVAGEVRVRYLHTLPGARDDVLAAWRAVLGDRAWVVPREEAVAAGWFGPVPEAHLARVGDVVAVCHDRYGVLATRSEPATIARLVAFHGSYTEVEMLVPLLVAVGG